MSTDVYSEVDLDGVVSSWKRFRLKSLSESVALLVLLELSLSLTSSPDVSESIVLLRGLGWLRFCGLILLSLLELELGLYDLDSLWGLWSDSHDVCRLCDVVRLRGRVPSIMMCASSGCSMVSMVVRGRIRLLVVVFPLRSI